MAFDLDASLERANRRLRARRSDAGATRLAPAVAARLRDLLSTDERPKIRTLQRDLREACARLGEPAPSRATIYNAISWCSAPRVQPRELPEPVQRALYNVDLDQPIDAALVAFYAFNHGDLRAACWAAGAPWLALHHALAMRGWRPRSRGLALAAARRRGIVR